MSWGMRPVLGLWLALLSCATTPRAEPELLASPPEDARQYYPLASGWRWAYDVEKGNERILAVYAVVQRNGEIATLQAGEEQQVYTVRPEGIARGEPGSALAGADFLLRSPVRLGAQWSIPGGTATVAAVARTVTVPAGAFYNCIVVEENRTSPARLVRTTYAPGTGPVAIDLLVHDEASGVFQPALRARLRGVTAPGADPLGP